jgi:hypothetical protein
VQNSDAAVFIIQIKKLRGVLLIGNAAQFFYLLCPVAAAIIRRSGGRKFFERRGKFMEENVTVVFRGFLNLNGREKLKLVEAINEYFDSMNREPIRAENETRFAELAAGGKKCPCCGK